MRRTDSPLRTPFQRDRDRIVHSKAFRRLKHKTQVFVAPEGDHYRTRLTHTLEVTQVSRTVARALSLNEDLVEAIGLGHDLGHPPFGHIGEAVLDALPARALRRRVPPLRALAAGGGRAGARRRRAEPDRAGARRDPLPFRPGADAGHARGPDRAAGRPDRLHQPRHRRRGAGRRARLATTCRRRRSPCWGTTGSQRIDALVHDLVEHSAARRGHRAGRGGGRGDGRAAGVHVRARVPGRGGAREHAAHRDRAAGAVRPLLRAPRADRRWRRRPASRSG